MKKSLIALCAVFALPFAAFAVAPPPPPPPLPPGSTMDSSRYDAPKTIASNEITMFKVQFTTSGGTYMTKKGDQWVENVEMNVRRPNGSRGWDSRRARWPRRPCVRWAWRPRCARSGACRPRRTSRESS